MYKYNNGTKTIKIVLLIGFDHHDNKISDDTTQDNSVYVTRIYTNNAKIINDNKDINPEPQRRTHIDMYLAYKRAITMGVDNLLVITDIDSDIPTTTLMKALLNKIVDAKILSFISDMKEKGYYHKYTNRKDMDMKISKYLSCENSELKPRVSNGNSEYFLENSLSQRRGVHYVTR